MTNSSSSSSNISNKKEKVYVGMSGGVDSSVSAYLLREAGYDVTGVFMKVWQPESLDGDEDCDWKDERRDAMRVAAKLDIPFKTFDFSEQYKREVVDYMISEYRAGRTPNPDVMCNRHVKFGSFLRQALADGIQYVATGHYAQNIDGKLLEGVDTNKDQSYFLWTLTPDDLKHVVFPVGHLTKPQVREIAKKAGLPVFDKKDSQGVCFIGHLDMKAFLKRYISTESGDIINRQGEVVGKHDGAALYTIGERHGLHIFNKAPDSEPYYVVEKDIAKNILVAETGAQVEDYLEDLVSKEVVLKNVSWTAAKSTDFLSVSNLSGVSDGRNMPLEARIRHRQERQSCKLTTRANGDVQVMFDTPQRGMAKGQSLVLYHGTTCLGGGIIG